MSTYKNMNCLHFCHKSDFHKNLLFDMDFIMIYPPQNRCKPLQNVNFLLGEEYRIKFSGSTAKNIYNHETILSRIWGKKIYIMLCLYKSAIIVITTFTFSFDTFDKLPNNIKF